MKPAPSQLTPDDNQQERVLRAVLHAHVPEEIDLDQAWTIFSQRLRANKQSLSHKRLLSPLSWLADSQHRPVSLKGKGVVAAVALIALLIASLTFLLPVFPGTDNLVAAKQYQPIGLSQSSHGTTFIADKAYASQAGTIIQFEVQPSADLMKLIQTNDFISAQPSAFTVKDQTEELKSSVDEIACYSFQHSGWPITCALVLSAFHPPAGTDKLDLIWDVSRITIESQSLSGRWSKVIQGTWHFHFTIPFHHGTALPILPDA